MNLNELATGTARYDMTGTEEFQSLLESAVDLSIPHDGEIHYASRNIVVRRQRFHLLEWGAPAATPIVALHGGHQSAHSWDLVNLNLAQRFRVIAPDQRGHGDSEWSRECAYSSEEMALDAAAMIQELDIERPIVMGHSMGGRNTLLLALRHPELCRALVVVDVGPEISDKGRKAITSFVAANEEFDDLDHFVRNVRRYDPYRSLEHIKRTVKYNLFKRSDGKYISKCDRAPRKLGVIDQQARANDITLDAVKQLRMPILVVRGANSNILTEEAAQHFVEALPNGQLVTVPGCGHNVHSQNTPGFIEAVRPFLESVGESVGDQVGY